MSATPPQQLPPIPSAAQGRLQHAAQGGVRSAFCGLSTLLTYDAMGLEPLGAVVGMSVLHLGKFNLAGLKQPVELEAFSQALSLGHYWSLQRLQEEASLLGADGVVLDSLFTVRRFDAEEHEYAIKGTAIRLRAQPGALRNPSGLPFVFPYSSYQLYGLLRHGYVPVNIGYGVCVYHVPHRSLRQALGQTFQNTEVPIMTDAWYTARELAVGRLEATLEQQGAAIIANVELSDEEGAFGEHTVEFRAFGVGLSRREGITDLIPAIDVRPQSFMDHGVTVTSLWEGAGI